MFWFVDKADICLGITALISMAAHMISQMFEISTLSRWHLWLQVSVLLFRFYAATHSGFETFLSQWRNIVIIKIVSCENSQQYHNWSLKLWCKVNGNISEFHGLYVNNTIQLLENLARTGNLGMSKFDFRITKIY